MSRALSVLLDSAMTGPRRSPTFRVFIYDIRSTSTAATPTRINDVVLLNLGVIASLPAIVGPREFTGDTERIDITEVAGDYVDTGIAATTTTLRIVDADGTLDPVDNAPSASDPRSVRAVATPRERDRDSGGRRERAR